MSEQKFLLHGIITALFCMFCFSGCFLFDNTQPAPDPEIIIATYPLNNGGATYLLAYDGKIFIGHITYAGTGVGAGLLQYYDPGTQSINTTGITEIDVVKMIYDTDSGRIYFINGVNTYYIDTNEEIASWSATEITGGPVPGADMALYNGNLYVLYTNYYSANNLYIIDAEAAALTNTIDLNAGEPTTADWLTKIGVDTANNKLYITDSADGDIYSANPDGSNIIHVTTTNAGSTGSIYFSEGSGYVMVGLTSSGDMGVHMFDTGNPGTTTTHFLDSGDLSAQFMVFEDPYTAYLTHYSGGVYEFDPSDTYSEFTILDSTDSAGVTGFQDILLSGGILYTTINNYPDDSLLMVIENF